MTLIRNYFRTVKTILLSPSKFFRDLPLSGGYSGPLTFALVTHWLGSTFNYLWYSLTGGAIEKFARYHIQFSGSGNDIDSPARTSQWMELQQKMTEWFWNWFWGAGSVILDPFKTLGMIFITSLFFYVGARLFVNSSKQTEVSYESAIRIVSFGMTPAIISAFPFIGGFISTLYVAYVTIIGAREAYRTSNSRAALIVLFPDLLFIGIIMMGIFLLAFLALKFAISI